MLDRLRFAFRNDLHEHGPHFESRSLQRGIQDSDIVEAVGYDEPEIIEDYPEDPRGHSCLIRGICTRGVIHVVCTVGQQPFVITSYFPDPQEWGPSFRERRE